MRAALVIVVAACGSSPAPTTVAPTAPPHAIAKTSCADAGVILRGVVEAQSPEAPHDRELAIERACTDDHWPAVALDCIGASRVPFDCLGKHLSPQIVASYQIALAEWAAKYEASSDLDPEPPPVSCDQVVAAIDKLSDDVTTERDWAIAARRRLAQSGCMAGWSQTTRQCISAAPDRDAMLACAQDLAAGVATIAARADAIASAKRKPQTIACTKVSAAYYGDAKWQDAKSLDRLSPADRKKAIAGSRTAMVRACAKDGWDDTLRACLATGGDVTCFADTNVVGWAWGYPAASSGVTVLPPECDDYRKLVAKLSSCTALPIDIRNSIVALQVTLEREAYRPDIGASCAAAAQTLQTTPGC